MTYTINTMTKTDPAKLKEYKRRIEKARQKLDDLGRGSRARAGMEQGIHPTRISRLLKGEVSVSTLERLESWLRSQ